MKPFRLGTVLPTAEDLRREDRLYRKETAMKRQLMNDAFPQLEYRRVEGEDRWYTERGTYLIAARDLKHAKEFEYREAKDPRDSGWWMIKNHPL